MRPNTEISVKFHHTSSLKEKLQRVFRNVERQHASTPSSGVLSALFTATSRRVRIYGTYDGGSANSFSDGCGIPTQV